MNEINPKAQEELEKYLILKSLDQSNEMLKDGLYDSPNSWFKKTKWYFRKRKFLNCLIIFKNWLVWSFKMLLPSFLVEYPSLWDNVKTLLTEPKFKALRRASVSWLIFVCAIGLSSVYLLRQTPPTLGLSGDGTDVVDTTKPITNGNVYSVLVGDDGSTYVGGNFSYVGYKIGKGQLSSVSTGERVTQFPYIDLNGWGEVKTSISDGNGGWFIGGYFSTITDRVDTYTRTNLAHITADGLVDPNWSPQPDNDVNSLYLNGDVLYVGGCFSNISGVSVTGVAAVNASTGTVTSLELGMSGYYNYIYNLNIDGNYLYVGGYFTAGTFNNILRYDLANSVVDESWDIDPSDEIQDILISGGFIYIGGLFTQIGEDTNLAHVARIDASTGVVDASWDPNINGGTVYTLDSDGTYLYVGGDWINYEGSTETINNLMRVAISGGAVDETWVPNPQGKYGLGAIYSIAVNGSDIFVGGNIKTIGETPVSQSSIAKLDIYGEVDSSWNGGVTIEGSGMSLVKTIIINGGYVFIGGSFSYGGGYVRDSLVKFNSNGEVDTNWNANLANGGGDIIVYDLKLDGSTLYIGGSFISAGGVDRRCVAALNISDASARSWDVGLTNSYSIDKLEVTDSVVYIAGDFYDSGGDPNVGGANRSYLAAIDKSTGLATDWNPNPNGSIYAIEVSGSSVYVGGSFACSGCNSIGGAERKYLAELDATTGLATDWNPNPNNYVRALEMGSSELYVAGNFDSVGGESRNFLAALDLTTGSSTSWNPAPNSYPLDLCLYNNTLYIAGYFTTIYDTLRAGLAAVDISNDVLTSWDPAPSGEVKTISTNGSDLVIGGSFYSVNDNSDITYLAFFNLSSASIGFTATESSGAESTTGHTIQITLSETSGSDISVDYAVASLGSTATGDGVDYTLASGTATVTAGNLTTNIELAVIDDSIDEGDETIVVTLSNPSGADLGSNTVHTVTIIDNDTAGITVTATSTSATEAGSTGSYTMVLDTVPSSDVTITLTPDSQVSVSSSTLTFTNRNWDTPQTVVVTAVDDSVGESTHTGTITHSASSLVDTNYHEILIDSVTVTIEDNETTGVTVTESGGSTDVTEGSTTDSYTLVLLSEPTGDVVITATPDDETTVSSSTLTFTASNWSVAQTITVTPVDDEDNESDHTSTISHTASSTDSNYSGEVISINDVTVNITDDDGLETGAAPLTISLNVGSSMQFQFTGGDLHTVTLNSISSGSASVTVQSAVNNFSLNAGGSTTIDSDGNGAHDMRVTATSIGLASATFVFDNYTPTGGGSLSTPGIVMPVSTRAIANGGTRSDAGQTFDQVVSVKKINLDPTESKESRENKLQQLSTINSTVTEARFQAGTGININLGNSTHSVVVSDIGANSVRFVFFSDPLYLDMVEGEEKTVDLDNDGIADLHVFVKNIDEAIQDVDSVITNLHDVVFTINDNFSYTESLDVKLRVKPFEGITKIAISDDPGFSKASFVDYAQFVDYKFKSDTSPGEKTLYVRLRSKTGAVVDISDTINLKIACPLEVEKAYKHIRSSAVYYVTKECTKRPFATSIKYFSYFGSWNDVVLVSQKKLELISDDKLGFMPWGPNYDPKYGALVKVVTDPRVYLLLGAEKYWITSEAVFGALKYAWNWVEDIDERLLDKYKEGGEIEYKDHHPNYTLIKYPGSLDVYRLEPDPEDATKQVKRYVPSEVFESLNFRYDRIVEIDNDESYEDGEILFSV